jgi:hypothetical protein
MLTVRCCTGDLAGVGEEGLTGNLLIGDDIFRGLAVLSEVSATFGDVRVRSIFKGEAVSRSMGLFVASRLEGDIFSRSELPSGAETSALKGELGGPSLSVSVDVCMVTS